MPKKQPTVTSEMRALIRDPDAARISVSYAYRGVVGADGLTRYDFTLAAYDTSGAEIARIAAEQTHKLIPALDSEITRAGFARMGEAMGGGMSGSADYLRA